MFLVLLTFAVQLLLSLYATSAVTAAAHDAAQLAARGSVDRADPMAVLDATTMAEDHARAVLGEYSSNVEFTWQVDQDWVRLDVVADLPTVAMKPVASAFGLSRLERTITVRVEQPR